MTKSDDKRVPALRFKGFTDEWEQRKLGHTIKYIGTGKSKCNDKSTGKYKILGSTGVIGYSNHYDYDGDFILTARVGANAGKLYRHSGKVKITDNTVFIQGPQLNFIYYLLSNFDLKKLSFGSGQPLIKASELKKLFLNFPITSIERKNIGIIFNKLECILSLQQRKLKDYSLIKKKLSNIFFNDTIVNQNNFLFKHRVKASQLFISFSKKGFVHLPVLSASQDKGMIFREDESKNILYAHNNLTNYKLVEPDDFVVHLRSFQGGFAYSDKTGIASPAYTIFKFKDDVDYNPVYWKEKFKSYNFIQLLKKVTYGVRDGRSISFSDFLSLYLTFPDIEIQNKIGSALSKLDTQISDQKKIIKKLENVKQFLLQNMFI